MAIQQNFTGTHQTHDHLNTVLKVVSFLLPIIGLILYLVYKKETPHKAKSAGIAALWGVGVGIVLNIIAVYFKGGR